MLRAARSYLNKARPDFISPDVLGGEVACAKVVSTILMEANMLDHVLLTVKKLSAYMEMLGWERSQTPHLGDIVVWDQTPEINSLHIGIVSGDNLAINNSSYDKMPVESAIDERPVLYYLTKKDDPEEEPKIVDSTPRIYFTSYNPVNAQTDSNPCTGASGKDQCEIAKTGVRVIALSQDLVGRKSSKPFHYGDKVSLKAEIPDPRCNGEFVVLDTMAERWKNRGDIFMPDSSTNIDCWAKVTKINT